LKQYCISYYHNVMYNITYKNIKNLDWIQSPGFHLTHSYQHIKVCRDLRLQSHSKSSHWEKYSEWKPVKTVFLWFFYFLNTLAQLSVVLFRQLFVCEKTIGTYCENEKVNNYSRLQHNNKTTHVGTILRNFKHKYL